MVHNVTLITGDGTGPELAQAARRVLDATGVGFNWVEQQEEAGIEVFEKTGDPFPETLIDTIKRTKVTLKAPITTPIGTGFRSVNVKLRKDPDLYINLRPAKSYEGGRSRYEKLYLVIFEKTRMICTWALILNTELFLWPVGRTYTVSFVCYKAVGNMPPSIAVANNANFSFVAILFDFFSQYRELPIRTLISNYLVNRNNRFL
jgi:hypothetical protein